MKKIKKQARQGDVLIHPINEIPESATKVEFDTVVLAEGEATGHAHRIESPGQKCDTLVKDSTLYLRVHEPVSTTHEEHDEAPIKPGDYIVIRQVEEWMDEVRQVMD